MDFKLFPLDYIHYCEIRNCSKNGKQYNVVLKKYICMED